MAKASSTAKNEPDLNEAEATPKKSKKKLILFIAATVLLVAGGIAAFLLLSPPPAQKRGGAASTEAAGPAVPPKYVSLGQFTANLMYENEDRYLQLEVSLKVTQPELEEKINATKPEILHRVNMLLQSKYPSELATPDGKERLAQQIKAHVEYVIGLRKTAPVIGAEPAATPTGKAGAAQGGVSDVLFTSFIIQ